MSTKHARRSKLFAGILVGFVGTAGCGGTSDPVPKAGSSETVAGGAGTAAVASGDKSDSAAARAAVQPQAPSPPSPAEIWNQRLAEARQLVESNQLDEFDQLRSTWSGDSPAIELPDEAAATLAELEKDAQGRRQAQVARDRAERLTQAQSLMDQGKLDDSLRAVGDVLARNPTDEQRQTAGGITEEIERRRKARRQLKSWLQLLASPERKNVQTAQTQLQQDPDTAVGMVLETLLASEPGPHTASYLETLRLLNRPEVTVPAMLDLLERSDRAPLWPDLVRELSVSQVPGLGARLLTLASQGESPEQRQAALQILSQAADPPAETLVQLLPVLAEDGPALPGALQAAVHAVRFHQQFDWIAARGFDGPLSAEQQAALQALGPRLAKLATGVSDPVQAEVASAAQSLAALLGLVESQPVTGVKIVRVESELPESPAAGAIDGIWNSVELKTLWRHPPDRKGSILLDLGADRIVAGVRVWNTNEPGAVQRGWKEIEVFVSSSPAELAPVASGLVPIAPGVANTPDYGTTIPVAAVRGRYVRLQAKSVWLADGPSGLSEVR